MAQPIRRESTKPKCGAKLRGKNCPDGREGTCRNPAGYKTDHVGTGKCKFHGGCSAFKPGPENPNYKHGGFSKHLQPDEEERFAAFRTACGLMQDEPSDEEELALFRLVTGAVSVDATPAQTARLLNEISEARLRYQKLRGGEKAPDDSTNLNAREELLSRLADRAARRRADCGTGEPE